MTKLLFPLLAVLAFIAGACAPRTIVPSSETAERALTPTPFTKIDVEAPVLLYYSTGAETAVKVSCASNLADRLSVRSQNGKLSVELDDNVSVNSSRPFATIYVTAPAVYDFETSTGATLICTDSINVSTIEIEAESGSKIEFGAIAAHKVDVECSSAASVTIADLRANILEAENSSAGSIKISGAVRDLDFEASSGSTISASALQAQTGKIRVSSAAIVECNVVNPTIEQQSAGTVRNLR